ncbi:MAG: hypothetical protein LBU74_03255 [Methanobacteriaceae archaeon]|nr:hypothetical protein [Candidatus Methanorudis spinitermitis]
MSSNFSTPLNQIKGNISIDFDNEKQAEIIYNSILLEFETIPDFRSKVVVELEKSSIKLFIKSEDSTSFRASINSAIKLIMLSLKITNLPNSY